MSDSLQWMQQTVQWPQSKPSGLACSESGKWLRGTRVPGEGALSKSDSLCSLKVWTTITVTFCLHADEIGWFLAGAEEEWQVAVLPSLKESWSTQSSPWLLLSSRVPSCCAVIRKHLTTSSLINGQIWRAIFQSHWIFKMFQYMHWIALFFFNRKHIYHQSSNMSRTLCFQALVVFLLFFCQLHTLPLKYDQFRTHRLRSGKSSTEHLSLSVFFLCFCLENQRTETLIWDDKLLYSFEHLHWPWMEDWNCVLTQCLPEVLHPSEINNNSAITFKAENVHRFQENNSGNCCCRVLRHLKFISAELCIAETSETHLSIHAHGNVCVKGNVRTDTSAHLTAAHIHKQRAESDACFVQEFDSASRLPCTLHAKCFTAIILPTRSCEAANMHITAFLCCVLILYKWVLEYCISSKEHRWEEQWSHLFPLSSLFLICSALWV